MVWAERAEDMVRAEDTLQVLAVHGEVVARAASRRARSAQRAASAAAMAVVLEPCPTSDMVRDRTSRRRRTNM